MTSFIKKNEIKNNWILINAENAIVGRLAAYISRVLRGKNKNQYGKKFGKKHADAMFEFTKTLWLQDATTSLRNLLQVEAAQVGLMKFLKVMND